MGNFNIRKINGSEVLTAVKLIRHTDTLKVEAGTTGECGNDPEYDSKTYIRITDLTGTELQPRFSRTKDGNLVFTLKLHNDSELYLIREALRFIVKMLDFETDVLSHEETILTEEKEGEA